MRYNQIHIRLHSLQISPDKPLMISSYCTGSWVIFPSRSIQHLIIIQSNQRCCQAIFSVFYCTLEYLGLVTGTATRKSETCVNVWQSSQRIILLGAIVVFVVVSNASLKEKSNIKRLPKVWNSLFRIRPYCFTLIHSFWSKGFFPLASPAEPVWK